VSYDERYEEAGARFWGAAKALLSLKNIDLLNVATDAMKQQAKEFAEGINGPHVGCMCERCIELREQIAAQPADAPDPTDAW
jgi:hypothetical protein